MSKPVVSEHSTAQQNPNRLLHIVATAAAVGAIALAAPHGSPAEAGVADANPLSSVSPVFAASNLVTRGGSEVEPSLFIAGDSMSDPLRYSYSTNPTNRIQSWGSKLSHTLGMRVIVSAQGGSGFLKPGNKPGNDGKKECSGTNFPDRLTEKAKRQIKHADFMVIEGGRNDGQKCNANGQLVPTTRAEVTGAVDSYMDVIAELRADKPGTTYVMTPWGMKVGVENKKKVTPIVRDQAEEHSFQFIDTTGLLDPKYKEQTTYDGIHPNEKGTTLLANRIIRETDLKKRVERIKSGE